MTEPRKGTCPVCRGSFRVNKNGTLHHHAGPPGSEPGRLYGLRRAYRCQGAGGKPMENQDHAQD